RLRARRGDVEPRRRGRPAPVRRPLQHRPGGGPRRAHRRGPARAATVRRHRPAPALRQGRGDRAPGAVRPAVVRSAPMRTRSSNSAGATYLDREARLAELRAMARRAAERVPAIRCVSDRNPEMIRAMSPLACPVDLFVYTAGELAEARSPVVAAAL